MPTNTTPQPEIDMSDESEQSITLDFLISLGLLTDTVRLSSDQSITRKLNYAYVPLNTHVDLLFNCLPHSGTWELAPRLKYGSGDVHQKRTAHIRLLYTRNQVIDILNALNVPYNQPN